MSAEAQSIFTGEGLRQVYANSEPEALVRSLRRLRSAEFEFRYARAVDSANMRDNGGSFRDTSRKRPLDPPLAACFA